MAAENPFADDPVRGEAWEEGYLAGFAEPEVDHLRPFAPEILDAYQQGEQAGRDERRQLPPDAGGVSEGEGTLESAKEFLKEAAKETGLHVLGHRFLHLVFGLAGGLITVVLTAIGVSTDTPMQPLEDDWTGPADQPDDVYVAVCPREDHPLVEQGVTAEGYWTGQGQQFFGDALDEMIAHGHAEAFVARCDVPDGVCGPVWVGPGQ